jgi:hypothetical protein
MAVDNNADLLILEESTEDLVCMYKGEEYLVDLETSIVFHVSHGSHGHGSDEDPAEVGTWNNDSRQIQWHAVSVSLSSADGSGSIQQVEVVPPPSGSSLDANPNLIESASPLPPLPSATATVAAKAAATAAPLATAAAATVAGGSSPKMQSKLWNLLDADKQPRAQAAPTAANATTRTAATGGSVVGKQPPPPQARASPSGDGKTSSSSLWDSSDEEDGTFSDM